MADSNILEDYLRTFYVYLQSFQKYPPSIQEHLHTASQLYHKYKETKSSYPVNGFLPEQLAWKNKMKQLTQEYNDHINRLITPYPDNFLNTSFIETTSVQNNYIYNIVKSLEIIDITDLRNINSDIYINPLIQLRNVIKIHVKDSTILYIALKIVLERMKLTLEDLKIIKKVEEQIYTAYFGARLIISYESEINLLKKQILELVDKSISDDEILFIEKLKNKLLVDNSNNILFNI